MNYHQSVLLAEVVNILQPKPGQIFLDATLGHAGHTLELLKSGATVFALDADSDNQQIAINRIEQAGLSQNFHPLQGNFANMFSIWQQNINLPLNGIVADLGLSVNQQKDSDRGFSFNDPNSLDMRLNSFQDLTAEEIINTYDRDQLYQLFTKYAQEKLSRPLVYEIIKSRQIQPIKTGLQLAQIIENYYHKKHLSFHHHPATKIFLALRIAVNHEFESLQSLLDSTLKICQSDANIAIISFHSGEDRLVKNFIRQHHFVSQKFLPSPDEIKHNPLSRSAVLRSYKIN